MTVATEYGVCGPDYNFPDWMRRGMIAYMASLLFLFMNFYLSSYLLGSSRGGAKKEASKTQNATIQKKRTKVE